MLTLIDWIALILVALRVAAPSACHKPPLGGLTSFILKPTISSSDHRRRPPERHALSTNYLITEADHARRLAIEVEILRIAEDVGLTSASAATDLAARLVHSGAEPSIVGVVLPSGIGLRDHLRDLRADPEFAHFWNRSPGPKSSPAAHTPAPAKTKATLNAAARRDAATAALDAINSRIDLGMGGS